MRAALNEALITAFLLSGVDTSISLNLSSIGIAASDIAASPCLVSLCTVLPMPVTKRVRKMTSARTPKSSRIMPNIRWAELRLPVLYQISSSVVHRSPTEVTATPVASTFFLAANAVAAAATLV